MRKAAMQSVFVTMFVWAARTEERKNQIVIPLDPLDTDVQPNYWGWTPALYLFAGKKGDAVGMLFVAICYLPHAHADTKHTHMCVCVLCWIGCVVYMVHGGVPYIVLIHMAGVYICVQLQIKECVWRCWSLL